MHVLVVGNTRIPYALRRSARARRRKIVVTPDRVEVVGPDGDGDEALHRFIRSRRRWVYDIRQKMHERLARATGPAAPGPDRLVTGAKLLYRGRRMALWVRPAAPCAGVQVSYRNGFVIERPPACPEADVSAALVRWLTDRVSRDADAFAGHHAPRLAVRPRAVRVRELKRMWGSCGKGGTVSLNWRLVFAPKPVLEYAVVHELCHLRYRDHSTRFWSAVRRALPDFERRKRWLEANEGTLDAIPLVIPHSVRRP